MAKEIQNQNQPIMSPPASAYFIAENTEIVVQHTLSVLVDNESGVLARVIGLFSGRGYNIESLTVSETEHERHLSRITIISKGTPKVLEQIKRQLERMVPVHRVVIVTDATTSHFIFEITGRQQKVEQFISILNRTILCCFLLV